MGIPPLPLRAMVRQQAAKMFDVVQAAPTFGWVIEVVEALEARIGMPVVTSSQTTVWKPLRLAGLIVTAYCCESTNEGACRRSLGRSVSQKEIYLCERRPMRRSSVEVPLPQALCTT
jgi:hypothetical protein